MAKAMRVVAGELRAARESKQWSRERLAAVVGRDGEFIAQLEQYGPERCTIELLRTLARSLGYRVDVHVVPLDAKPTDLMCNTCFGVIASNEQS